MKAHPPLLLSCLLVALIISGLPVNAQTSAPDELAESLGFSKAEIVLIKGGEIAAKLPPGESDKELAGAVKALLDRPVGEAADIGIQGKMLKSDKKIRAFRGWQPDEAARWCST